MGIAEADVCNSGDGIGGHGAWTSPGHSAGDEITAGANNPAGGGFKGFRHWVGDGLNRGGGGISISFSSTSEMWFRYYIRFQQGFSWGNQINMKTIYCNQGSEGTFYFGLHQNAIGGVIGGSSIHHSLVTWQQMQGGSTGDGNFHVLEVHAKMNSTGTSNDGVFEFWWNDTLIYSNSSAHFSDVTGAKFGHCTVGSNHNDPQNGGDVYVDFDDIAISATGYIGPIGSLRPPAPRNLRIQ
jgi:hypothetical protein